MSNGAPRRTSVDASSSGVQANYQRPTAAYKRTWYGEIPAFLYAWICVFLLKPSTMAIICLPCGQYLAQLTLGSSCDAPVLATKLYAAAVLSRRPKGAGGGGAIGEGAIDWGDICGGDICGGNFGGATLVGRLRWGDFGGAIPERGHRWGTVVEASCHWCGLI